MRNNRSTRRKDLWRIRHPGAVRYGFVILIPPRTPGVNVSGRSCPTQGAVSLPKQAFITPAAAFHPHTHTQTHVPISWVPPRVPAVLLLAIFHSHPQFLLISSHQRGRTSLFRTTSSPLPVPSSDPTCDDERRGPSLVSASFPRPLAPGLICISFSRLGEIPLDISAGTVWERRGNQSPAE